MSDGRHLAWRTEGIIMRAKKIILWILVMLSTLVFSEQKQPALSFCEPNYLLCALSGSDHYAPFSSNGKNRMKLHIGFNYRILSLKNDRSGLYLGYYQSLFWKEMDPRKPFIDNNIRPELSACLDMLKWFTGNENFYIPQIKATVSRESNWESGINYRGWDKIIGTMEIGEFGKTEYHCLFSYWKAFNVSSHNPDIQKYAGNTQIKIGYWCLDGDRVAKWGTSMDMRFSSNSPDINSIAVSVYYNPLVGRNLKWIPSFMVEYFYGWAESLLYYKERSNCIRVGIALM